MEDKEMTTQTKLTDALEDDFFDDAVTAQYLVARLIKDALADLADEETGDDRDWILD
jgi:hypothetical protein